MLFLYFLNYFWLSKNPDESARAYCDQHCFKIHSELITSIWDVVLELAPELVDEALEKGVTRAYINGRHSKHPLTLWNGICLGNCLRSLLNAKSLLEEHKSRTGTIHCCQRDWDFLSSNVHRIDFSGPKWKKWQRFSFPKNDPEKQEKWDSLTKSLGVVDNKVFTNPPRCINQKEFPSCNSKYGGFYGLLEAYRKYYQAKVLTVKPIMRYFYTEPPVWLKGEIMVRKDKKSIKVVL
jgi:hypothetical protein